MRELTITYKIECTEVIKSPGAIDAILMDGKENVADALEMDLRKGEGLDVDDLLVRDVKFFLMEETR